MFSAPSETFTILQYVDPAGRQLLPFYADNRAQLLPNFASGARQDGAAHPRTGMPIALAVSHTSMHPRAHGVGPAGTTCMALHGTP